MTDKQMSRLNQIVEFVIAKRGGGGATRAEICRALGLKKSPYTIALIEKCVADGWIEKDWGVDAVLPYLFYTPSTMALARIDYRHDEYPLS